MWCRCGPTGWVRSYCARLREAEAEVARVVGALEDAHARIDQLELDRRVRAQERHERRCEHKDRLALH